MARVSPVRMLRNWPAVARRWRCWKTSGIGLGTLTFRLRHAKLDRQLANIAEFRIGLEQAFAPPADCASHWPDDMTVCRCEEIDAGTLRRCIRAGEASEINRLKALTRVGMGRCQGRMCGAAAAELLSAETGKPIAEVGRLRGQAPIKPVPLSIAMMDEASASGSSRRHPGARAR